MSHADPNDTQRTTTEEPRPTFRGTDRFDVRESLGSGSFGVVYSAYDKARGANVALKLLRRASPTAMMRFKQEFRALADVSHPGSLRCTNSSMRVQRARFEGTGSARRSLDEAESFIAQRGVSRPDRAVRRFAPGSF